MPSLPGPLWPREVAPDKVQSMSQIELNSELFELELFICIKMDLALNNLQGLICHKNKPNTHLTEDNRKENVEGIAVVCQPRKSGLMYVCVYMLVFTKLYIYIYIYILICKHT